MKNKFRVFILSVLFLFSGVLIAKADTTYTCYNACSPVYSNWIGRVILNLQCNSSSPASYSGSLTVNGVSLSYSKTCVIPVNGVCGSASMTYPSATTAWPQGTNFCSSGTASPLSPSFPASGSTTNWQCVGSGGGSTVNCSATRTASLINGSCGTRNTTYASATAAWPVGSTLCSSGTASPATVTFPASGSTASWQCVGGQGGTNASCLATHQAAAIPVPTLTFNASPTTVSSGGTSTLTWSTTNVTSCYSTGDWLQDWRAVNDSEPQLNITTNKTYTMECWSASGGTTGPKTVFVTVTVPTNGSCGTRDTTYPASTAAWPGGSTLCSAGNPSPVNPSFPAAGSSTVWSCNGISGGSNDSCTATRLSSAINGACGTRNTSYSNSITDWPGGSTLCSVGTASPVNPLFPNINSSTPWQCLGSGGGSDANCSASRINMPIDVDFKEVRP